MANPPERRGLPVVMLIPVSESLINGFTGRHPAPQFDKATVFSTKQGPFHGPFLIIKIRTVIIKSGQGHQISLHYLPEEDMTEVVSGVATEE